MGLHRKLAVTFGALAFMALLIVGATLWANAQYASADAELRRHYTRSLNVQQVRSAIFRATEELSDAAFQREDDYREDFAVQIGMARRDLDQWAKLADRDEERQEVAGVREAFSAIVAQSERVFDAAEEGRIGAARRLYESRLDQLELDRFEVLTDRAVASDRRRRTVVRDTVTGTRRTGQLVLLIAAFATVSLVLLIGAYLASDVFRPLGRLREALTRVRRGDRSVRLDDGRGDELGEIQREFDRMVHALSEREAQSALLRGTGEAGEDDGGPAGGLPSRLALHRLVARLQARVAALDEHPERSDAVVRDLDDLVHTIGRMTQMGFPLDLDLARVDVSTLLHEVAERFRDDLIRRDVRLELAPSPSLDAVLADRLKLRAVLSELVDNALAALPERGGSLGLRAQPSADGTSATIDVVDDGQGVEVRIDALLAGHDGNGTEGGISVGLASSRAIVEAHGGRLLVDSRPGRGTLVRVELPTAD